MRTNEPPTNPALKASVAKTDFFINFPSKLLKVYQKGLITINQNQIKFKTYFIQQLEFREYDLEKTIIAMSKNFASMPNTVREAHAKLSVSERNEIIKELAMMGSDQSGN
ncbi:hypothetical protein [Secundilactobacillus kimchicus]|uniref:hypothetical protein n=1 Tax=Secundilactobacillus kimchicus TaxID=528209 RepID=UPI0006E270DE|nr:hypothetical protein [Secundilactobacillus kimchicus]